MAYALSQLSNDTFDLMKLLSIPKEHRLEISSKAWLDYKIEKSSQRVGRKKFKNFPARKETSSLNHRVWE